MAHEEEEENEADNETQESNGGGRDVSLDEVLYSTASFHAIVKPVSLAMILSAVCVVYINTPETLQQGQEQLANSYVVFETSEDDSTATKVGLSLTNAIIIVSVLAGMTFIIVLLYKYRCLKCLIGYMIFASCMLLGFLGGSMFQTAIYIYDLTVDMFTFFFTMYNFAVVGTASIFWQRGFPMWVTQGYLIATSVILAWQLSKFDPWTAWVLLIVLALYDLCAVLTPCGPLKALVNLMQRDDAPEMPGLLYEAELPPEAQRPGTRPPRQAQQQQRSSTTNTTSTTTVATTTSSTETGNETEASTEVTLAPTSSASFRVQSVSSSMTEASIPRETDEEVVVPDVEAPVSPNGVRQRKSATNRSSGSAGMVEEEAPVQSLGARPEQSETWTENSTAAEPSAVEEARMEPLVSSSQVSEAPPPRPTASLPFAIAKIYKLPLASPEPERRSDWTPLPEGETETPNEMLRRMYTPEQLKSEVVAFFPRNGGRIDQDGDRYIVKDRHGIAKRRLFLDNEGRVMEERQLTPEEEREEARKNNTIKLGLGDFIFYSVLVSKAVLYSFTTFAACMLVILAGLGITLILLAVYKKALPALPISIFLGVVFYLLTRALIEPWIEKVLLVPYYV